MTTTEGHDLFSLLGDLKLTIGSLAGQQERANRNAELARQRQEPFFGTVRAQTTIAANGEGVAQFDGGAGPASGFLWHVRRLTVNSATASILAGVTGQADVYIVTNDMRQWQDPAVQQNFIGWCDRAASLPSIAFYGIGELTLRYPEKLYILFSGGTVGNVMVATAAIQVEQEGTSTQVSM